MLRLRDYSAVSAFGRLGVLVLLCSVVLSGCGSGPYRSAPVDASKARATLKIVLDGWKAGETTESLKSGTPSIVVQDLDWSNGARLLDYEVLGAGDEVDANLIAKVRLKLQDKEGAATEKTVHYVVGTAPVLTVFRDMFR